MSGFVRAPSPPTWCARCSSVVSPRENHSSAETIGKQKQAAKRDADAKQAAKEAAEAKAAAEAEAKAAAEAGDGDAAESTEA